jgi:predicted ATPase/DNA-binding CsgD family transcriptional regulator/DNA-binding winged helix-turn-helix (wHTH) protein
LLCLLVEKRDTALSKEDILSAIWGSRVVSESSLSSCIKAARQAIGDSGEQQLLIKTIRGFGFRFVGAIDAQKLPLNNTISHQQNVISDKEEQANLASKNILNRQINPISGRLNELSRFKQLVGDCTEQYSQVVLLSGAAGVGKTRLLEEVTYDAQTQGFTVLWGRCREESGAPAYWPWRHLLIGHFKNQTLISAQEFPELANLLPELFNAKTFEISRGQLTADQYRFRLFQSITTLITLALKEQALFLVFDDLHQADHASLSLLEYVVSELDQPGLFIVGTYRDNELHATHRFLQSVSELSRLQKFTSIHLEHLNSESVSQWARHSLNDCTPKLIDTIMSRTDGHPLYVSETIRHLKQGGSPDKLPISLKAIISQRFSRLPSSCIEIMRSASVIGRRFDVAALSAITGRQSSNVLSELDHAVLAGQVNLADKPGEYQFSHIIVRETLYDSLLNSDRLHLHCNFAEYLEESHAESGELAFHFHQAAPLVNISKATFYARKAAEEANQLLAFEISVKYYQLALRTAKKDEELTLMLALGQSQIKSGESTKAVKTLEKVLLLSEQSQNHSEYALAAIGIEEALWRPGISSSILVSTLTKALANLDNHEKELKIIVIGALIRAQMMCGDIAKDKALLQQAKKLLSKIDEPLSEARVLLAELYTTFIKKPTKELFEIRMEKSRRALDLAAQCGDDFLMTEVLSWRMQDLFVCGRISEVESLLQQQLRYGLATKQPFFRYYLMMWRSLFCMAKGELIESEQHANSAVEVSKWLPGLDGDGVYGFQMFSIKREQGVTQGLSHLVNNFVAETTKSSHWNPGLALIYCDIGELDRAKVLYQSLLVNKLEDLPFDSMWLACIAYLSEVSYRLKDQTGAKILYEALLPHKDFNILVGANIVTFGLVDRYLGLLSSVNKQYHLAEQYFQNAIEQNEKQGLLVCAVHAKYNLAQLYETCHRLENLPALLEDVIIFTQKSGMKLLYSEAIQLKNNVKPLSTNSKVDPNALSKRERQVLEQIVLGSSNKDIAEKLFISENTVAAHIRHIFEKTGAKSRTEAAHFAVQANKPDTLNNN